MSNRWVGQHINNYVKMVLLEDRPKEKEIFVSRYKTSVAVQFIVRIVAMSAVNNLAMNSIYEMGGVADTIMSCLIVTAWLMYIKLGLEDVTEFTSNNLIELLKRKIVNELGTHKIKDETIMRIDDYIKVCIDKNGVTRMSLQDKYKFDRYRDKVNFFEVAGVKFFYIKDRLVVLCDDVLQLYKRENQDIVHMIADFRVGDAQVAVVPESEEPNKIAFILLRNKQKQSMIFEGRDIGI